jgi:hypothetical protein
MVNHATNLARLTAIGLGTIILFYNLLLRVLGRYQAEMLLVKRTVRPDPDNAGVGTDTY